MDTLLMSLVFGAFVGFALGLTGGGGSIFAVPLLVYAMAVPAHEAVGVSLAAVGATAAIGLVQRIARREVEFTTGLLFAITGMAGAPVGAWLNSRIPASWLLVMFAGLMLTIAVRMWYNARPNRREATDGFAVYNSEFDCQKPTCQRDTSGRLRITSRCALLLTVMGLTTGVLSGLFGVGGGFVIVPALVLFSGMGIHRAVATSLIVIALVSVSGIASYLVADRVIDFRLAGLFAAGGVAGMWLGTLVGRRIAGPALQRGFSLAIVAVAIFTAIKSLIATGRI